ncbi:MAG: efflux transporter outer membrane subunit [Pirellulales bacterium]
MPSRTRCTALCLMIATIAISFAGCKVGPNFARPWTRVNDNWAISSRPEYYGNLTDLSQWWLHLNDPTLTELICTARMQNLSIQEAGARVLEARYRQAVATGNLFPQAQAGVGSFSNAKTSTNVANFFSIPGIFTPNTHPENWQVGLQASWELDFWGRYRRIIEAAEATACEREAIHQDVMVLVCSEVAAAYVEIRSLEAQMELASRNLEIQQRTLKIAEDKLNAGLGNAIDSAQARTILGQTESVIPGLEIRRRQSNHRLCLLLGYPPADLTGAAGATGNIPEPSINLAFGIPADLLRRRPDVRSAERRLAAQSAKIGVAEAEFYPHISLLGSIGYSA